MKKYSIVLGFLVFLLYACTSPGVSVDGRGSGSGETTNNSLDGSYASILPVGDYVYAINRTEIVSFKKTDDGLQRIDKQDVGFGVENIYHFDGNLFIGSRSGMYIYTITENGVPQRRSHQVYGSNDAPWQGPCDPVIVRGTTAYVTLNSVSEGPCSRSNINELRLYDVADIDNPNLHSVTRMKKPKGLGIKGSYLYVCEDTEGVTIMDVSDVKKPKLYKTISGITAHDLIINGNKLAVVGPTQINQYDITDVDNIKEYGTIILD